MNSNRSLLSSVLILSVVGCSTGDPWNDYTSDRVLRTWTDPKNSKVTVSLVNSVMEEKVLRHLVISSPEAWKVILRMSINYQMSPYKPMVSVRWKGDSVHISCHGYRIYRFNEGFVTSDFPVDNKRSLSVALTIDPVAMKPQGTTFEYLDNTAR